MFYPLLCFKVLHQKVVLVCRDSITISPPQIKKYFSPSCVNSPSLSLAPFSPKHSTVTASVESCAYANIRVSWRRLSQYSQNSSRQLQPPTKMGGWEFGDLEQRDVTASSFFFLFLLFAVVTDVSVSSLIEITMVCPTVRQSESEHYQKQRSRSLRIPREQNSCLKLELYYPCW